MAKISLLDEKINPSGAERILIADGPDGLEVAKVVRLSGLTAAIADQAVTIAEELVGDVVGAAQDEIRNQVAIATAAAGVLNNAIVAGTYATKKDAITASLAGTFAAGAIVDVIRDEDCSRLSTRYQQINAVTGQGLGYLSFVRILSGTASPAQASTLPSGLAAGCWGYWNAKDIQTAPVHVIPNRASTTPVEARLNRFTRNAFTATGSEASWLKVPNDANITVTDRAAITHDGRLEATRIQMVAGVSRYVGANADWIPAGPNTFTFKYASWSTANQDFQVTGNSGTTKTPFTATPYTQVGSITVTNTVGQNKFRFYNDALNSALDIKVWDVKVWSGAVAGVEYPNAGHMYLGRGEGDTPMPTAANGILDMSGGLAAYIDFPDQIATKEFTLQVLCQRDNDGASFQNNYLFMSRDKTIGMQDLAARGGAGRPEGLWGSAAPSFVIPDSLDIYGKGFHVLTFVIRQNRVLTYLDDCLMNTENGAGAFQVEKVLQQFQVGSNATTQFLGYKLGIIALYTRALTHAEVRGNVYTMIGDAGAGIVVTLPTRHLMVEGDSVPTFGDSYAVKARPNLTAGIYIGRNSVSGSTLTSTTTYTAIGSRAADIIAAIPARRTGRIFGLTIHDGANDLSDVAKYPTTAAFLDADFALADAFRAAGYKLGRCTIPPKGVAAANYATHNTRRAVVNPLLLASVGAHYDFAIDFAGNATLGPDAAANDPALQFADGIHWLAAAHAIAEAEVFTPAVNAALA